MENEDVLFQLSNDVFAHYQIAKGEIADKIKGIPILFFGDIKKYSENNIKVLTIGQNPSRDEFPDSFERFKNFAYFASKSTLTKSEFEKYQQMLQKYFYYNPYRRWFSQFNWYLEQFSSSYEEGAIHIDLYSTLATSPTWGGLTQKEQNIVSQTTVFEKLFDFLNPDIVLCNFDLGLLANKIKFDSRIEEKIQYGKKRLKTKFLSAGKSGKSLFIGNTSGPSPFAYVTSENRESFFKKIKQNFC